MPNINLSWLSLHAKLPNNLSAEQLAKDLVKVGIEEETIHNSNVTGSLVLGKVLSKNGQKQTNGKLINWCEVDVGKHNTNLGYRGIICGADNFIVEDLVVVALPGAVLAGDFVITARKTYNHISDGMICSAKELGLSDDSDGIITVKDNKNLFDYKVLETKQIGDDIKDALGLNKDLLEVNITPDRAYCLSYRGIAREYCLSTDNEFIDRAKAFWPTNDYKISDKTANLFKLDDKQPINKTMGCDRFVGLKIQNINPKAKTP
ncbi:MAG: phenylalanine--tRNA ligase subunit beta, partial [Bifidobacteriaceae bacterium]|nr:phenylalanine--tRNA ligase subunit beta [Bifidobacteriaceae bacterium]